MSTVASLQIKIGADVSAAINGLNKAEFAANQVKKAYIEANDTTIRGGQTVAIWAQNFTQAIGTVQRDLDRIDLSKLDDDSRNTTSSMLEMATGALKISENVTTASATFTGMQQVAGPALAGIAKMFPTIAASIASLAGPIGIAVGALAAGAALIVSNWDLVSTSISEVETVTIAANKATQEHKAKALELIDVLKTEVSTRKEQSEAIKKLNEISPTYFGNLSAEKSTVDDLNIAYTAYAANLDNIAKLQAINIEVGSLYQKQVQTQIALENAKATAVQEQLKFEQTLASVREGTKNELPLILAKNTVKELDKQLNNINGQISAYKKLGAAIPKPTSEPSYEGDSDKKSTKSHETNAQKIAKIYANALAEIKAKEKEFKEGFLTGSEFDDFAEKEFKSAYSAIAKIDVQAPQLPIIKGELEGLKTIAPLITVDIAVKPVADIATDVVDTLRSETLGKLQDIELQFRFTGNPEDALKAKITVLNNALEELGKNQNVNINDDAVIVLQNELAIVQSQLNGLQNKPIKINAGFDFKKLQSEVSEAAGYASQFNDIIADSEKASYEKRLQQVDNYYAAQKDEIERTISDEGIKNKKLENLEKEVSKQKRQIKREEAAANKRSNIFSAIINTARAVAEALPNIGLSVVVGALGAAQVAAIASAPLPALAAGGLVDGPTAVLVGEYAGAKTNPEFIAPVSKAQTMIIEAVTQVFEKQKQEKETEKVEHSIKTVEYKIKITDNIERAMADIVATIPDNTKYTEITTTLQEAAKTFSTTFTTLPSTSASTSDTRQYTSSDILQQITQLSAPETSQNINISIDGVLKGDDIMLLTKQSNYRKSRLG